MRTGKNPKQRLHAADGGREPQADRSMKGRRQRICLVDDHPLTREGLVGIISQQPDLEVCGEAGSPGEALSLLTSCRPDLLVTDLTMPGRSGIEFIKDVHAILPELPILVLSMHDEQFYGERALRAGARGYLMKDAGSAKVLEVIRMILEGQAYVSRAMGARLLEAVMGRRPRGSSSPIERLSDREFEVLQLIGSGQTTKEVAQTLGLSPKTVDVHRGRIKEKLKIGDATGLVHYAVRWVESQSALSPNSPEPDSRGRGAVASGKRKPRLEGSDPP